MATRNLSIEDGQLNQRTLVTSRTKDYSDVDATFELRSTGDLYRKIDAASVKQGVKNVILTNWFEKPFAPRFGANLQQMLFELVDEDSGYLIERRIEEAIENHEPRASLINVFADVANDNNSIFVRVVFKVVNTNETITLETRITRVR